MTSACPLGLCRILEASRGPGMGRPTWSVFSHVPVLPFTYLCFPTLWLQGHPVWHSAWDGVENRVGPLSSNARVAVYPCIHVSMFMLVPTPPPPTCQALNGAQAESLAAVGPSPPLPHLLGNGSPLLSLHWGWLEADLQTLKAGKRPLRCVSV